MSEKKLPKTCGVGDLRHAPGKTFLVGEYLALHGGPSLLISTEPQFTFKTLRSVPWKRAFPFPPQSPAGRLVARHESNFEGVRVEFHDPHRGKGGLGASSAQFALLYTWMMNIRKIEPSNFDWKSLLAEYLKCAWSGEGMPPSGADVVAQLTGGICWFDGRENLVQKLSWPFENLGFTLIRTGTKLATHEHLKEAKAAPQIALREVVLATKTAFDQANEKLLVSSVNEYSQLLQDADLTARATHGLLSAMKSDGDWALAAKGCGAMGADVILVIHERARAKEVAEWADKKDLETCGDLTTLAEGLAVRPPRADMR
jgi:mevalonate kinase